MRRHLFSSAFCLFATSSAAAYANPTLTQGVWTEITPAGVVTGDLNSCLGQGIALDRKSPSTLYWGNTPYDSANGGIFKTTDGGSNWTRVASVTPLWAGASDHLDEPLHVRIDPNDSNHLYAGDGVRGSSQGFYVSHDAGATFVKPKGFSDARTAAGIDNEDIYDVAADPTDFSHVLVSFHYRWGWTDTKWNTNSGVMESKDGGATWIIHDPMSGWGSGHAVKFLYNPALGLGNSQTWLVATQGGGFWRTTDSGANWTKVSSTNITHGGGSAYYTKAGVLYTSGSETSMRSTDNGATFSSIGPNSTWCLWGDGTTLYTGKSFGANQPFSVSLETDGVTWTAQANGQKFPDGPYEMTYDAVNGIMYSSNWSSGVWALKVGPGNPDAGAGGSTGSGGATGAGGSTGSGGSVATGGSTGAGGSTGSGGAMGAGGSKGSGGAVATGGSTGAGGAIGVGGAAASGGRTGAGGSARIDAGAGGGKSASGGAGGQATSAAGGDGAPTEGVGPTADGGCACRVSNGTRAIGAAPLFGLALGLALARRRRTVRA